MQKLWSFLLLLLLGIPAVAQRLATPSMFYLPDDPTITAQSSFSKGGKTFSIGGGEFRFSPNHRVGIEGVTLSTLQTDMGRIQKNTMAFAGLSVRVWRIRGFCTQVFISQGVGMLKSIARSTYAERNFFEGLNPVFTMGMGMEYKMGGILAMFSKVRWVGGDINRKGMPDYQFGGFVLNAGISCKIRVPKRISPLRGF